MKITHAIALILVAGLLLGQATGAQRTEVVVEKGKVRVEAPGGQATLGAGQKALITSQGELTASIDDAVVEDILEMGRWIKEERAAGHVKFMAASVQAARLENPEKFAGYALIEVPSGALNAEGILRVGKTTLLRSTKYYDMKGKLIPFDVEKVSDDKGFYFLHFDAATIADAQGGPLRFILVAEQKPDPRSLWQEGPLWYMQISNDSKDFLNYFRFILPPSAIFVDSTARPVVVSNSDGGVAVTVRNVTGPQADGSVTVAFLWPEKDGTGLADLPKAYRGLEDPRVKQLAEEYRRGMRRILSGQDYRDFSTPLRAMLTWTAAIAQRNPELLAESRYTKKGKRPRAESIASWSEDQWKSLAYWAVEAEEFLSTPPWPQHPAEGTIHPVQVARKGSRIRSDTHAYIYSGGRWVRLGNMGNPWDTDMSVWEKYK